MAARPRGAAIDAPETFCALARGTRTPLPPSFRSPLGRPLVVSRGPLKRVERHLHRTNSRSLRSER